MSVEEVFHLRKDTKVYIIFNPDNMDSQVEKIKTKNTFERMGYNYIKYQPYADPAADNGYQLRFGGKFQLDARLYAERVKWYSFANILRKIRKEETPVIITFAGHSLIQDIPKDIESSDFEIIGYNFNLNNQRISDPKAGMYITPLLARSLFKDKILKDLLRLDMNDYMIKYYNEIQLELDEEKYKYLSVCKI